MADDVPAGWYPTPDGKQRYWDGQRWTNLPWNEETDATTPASESADAMTPAGPPRRSSTKIFVALGIIVVVLIAVIAGGFALASSNAAQAKEAAHLLQVSHAKQVAAAKAASKKRKDDAERASRASEVKEIQSSVKTMAKKHAHEGIIDGPILSATCSPTNGGSTDDLTQQTTVFECFVADKNNKDGTQSGYYYNATMNWTTGSFTYGLGKPGS